MDVVKLWRCPTCNRVLRERTVGEAQRRHAELVRQQCGGQAGGHRVRGVATEMAHRSKRSHQQAAWLMPREGSRAKGD